MENSITKLLRGTRIFYKLLNSKITGKRIPLVTNILVTNRCNLNCFYCFPQVHGRKVRELTTKEILDVIDESKKLGAEVIILLGGEPLLREDIGIIIDHVKKRGLLCEVITNGYFVEKWIDYLKKVDSICISIDGDEKGNDKNRCPGSYKVTVRALKLARQNGIFTRIHAVLTKYTINEKSIDHLVNLCRELDTVATFAQPSEHTKHKAFNVSDKEFKKAFTKILEYKRKGYPIGNSEDALKYIIKWPFPYDTIFKKGKTPKDFKPIKCQRKNLTCYIDTSGVVYPCAFLWEKCNITKINFLEKGFKEAWDSLDSFDCESCGVLTDMDLNLLLQLNLGALINTGKYYIKDSLFKFKRRFKRNKHEEA